MEKADKTIGVEKKSALDETGSNSRNRKSRKNSQNARKICFSVSWARADRRGKADRKAGIQEKSALAMTGPEQTEEEKQIEKP